MLRLDFFIATDTWAISALLLACLLGGHHRLLEVLPLGLLVRVGARLAVVSILVDCSSRVVDRAQLLRTLVEEVEVEDVVVLRLAAVRVPMVVLLTASVTSGNLALFCVNEVHVAKLVEVVMVAGLDEWNGWVDTHQVVLVAARQQVGLRTVHRQIVDRSLRYQWLEVVGISRHVLHLCADLLGRSVVVVDVWVGVRRVRHHEVVRLHVVVDHVK